MVQVFSEKCQSKLMKLSQDFLNGLMCIKQNSTNEIQNNIFIKKKVQEEMIQNNLMEIEISHAICDAVPEDTNFSLD